MTAEIFQHCKFIYYCDDLVVYASGDTLDEMQNKLQSDITNLTRWCTDNGMEINVSKTKSMIFHSRNKNPNNRIYFYIIDQLRWYESLNTLVPSFKTHLNLTYTTNPPVIRWQQECTCSIDKKNNFTTRWKKLFVTSLVLSILDYCLPVWGNLALSKLKRINKIILRAAKLVVRAHHFKKPSKLDRIEHLNWLLCQERLDVYSLSFIYKNIWRKTFISNSFTLIKKRETTERSSKLENNFIVPVIKKEIGRTTFSYRAITLWNNLPPDIRNMGGYFDNIIRKHIMSKRDSNVILTSL